MKKEKIVSLLIPFIAVVVVVESVILVSNLSRNVSKVETSSEVKEITPTQIIQEPVVDFVFETENKEMKLGKSYKVNLNLVGKKDINLDAMEIYVKYDPSKVAVSKYVVGDGLPKEEKISGVNSKTGLISSVFLWGVGKSYSVKLGDVNSILSFVVTPKVEGETTISLVTGNTNEKSVSLVVESSTSKSLSFLGNGLEINVTK